MKTKQVIKLLCAAFFFTAVAAGFCGMTASAAVGDRFTENGINYQVTAEPTEGANGAAAVVKNSCSGVITIPPIVLYGGNLYDVTSIEGDAFIGCTGLTGVTIPDSVTSIGYFAFAYCTGLTSITIPNGITSIKIDTFSGCGNLTSVTIPNSVTSIEYNAFSNCNRLAGITIPASVTSIEMRAFSKCIMLSTVYFDGDSPVAGYDVFTDCFTHMNMILKPYADGSSVEGHMIYHYSTKTISVDSTISNGTITPSTTAGMRGETVSLAIAPAAGYTLQSGSLKYTAGSTNSAINGTSFTMPSTDVIITGEFEAVPVPLFTSAGGVTNDSTPTWSWSDQAGYGYYRYKLDGAAGWKNTASNMYTPSADLSAGTHTLEVEEINSLGDWSLSSLSSFTIDTAPTASLPPSVGKGVSLSTACVILSFSENVTGVANGTVTVSDGSRSYTYTIRENDGYATGSTVSIPISAFTNGLNEPLTLTAGTTYTVSISAGAYKNAHGSTVAGGVAGSFTTATAYNVTFDKNSGDLDASPISATASIVDGTVTLPETNPTRAGYTFAGWNTASDGTGTTVTSSTMVTRDITVFAQWTVNSPVGGYGYANTRYTITASAGNGGSVTPSGRVFVVSGSDKTYVIASDEGYQIKDILVDGVSVGAVDTYTFKSVKKTHTITASFAEKKLSILLPAWKTATGFMIAFYTFMRMA